MVRGIPLRSNTTVVPEWAKGVPFIKLRFQLYYGKYSKNGINHRNGPIFDKNVRSGCEEDMGMEWLPLLERTFDGK